MTVDGDVERCIRSEYARLVGVVCLITGSLALAEEAVQEAFARAWQRVDHGQRFEDLAAWVATVALNLARTGRRRRATERRALERLAAVPVVPHRDPRVEVSMVVRSAIDGLAPRQRDAVVLYYLLDVDVATVASLLGISEGTVKTALARARTRLAVLLSDQELEA